MISEVDNRTLRSEISERLGIPYLGKATEDGASRVVKYIDSYLYGYKSHPILPCVASSSSETRWVFFIVDTGAPATYLSPQVSAPYL